MGESPDHEGRWRLKPRLRAFRRNARLRGLEGSCPSVVPAILDNFIMVESELRSMGELYAPLRTISCACS